MTDISQEDLFKNFSNYTRRQDIARFLVRNELFKKIIKIKGSIIECGVHQGGGLMTFAHLSSIYEPYNYSRKIIGFDTFKGFPSIHSKDGKSSLMKKGQLDMTRNYEIYLEKIMKSQEDDNPLSHIKKFEICKGDATKELPKYLKKNPETIVSLAYFDLDIYEPTKQCLKQIEPRLVKGSVIGFDELNDPDSPGETLALMETLGLNNIRLKRHRFASRVSFFVVE